VDFPYRHRHLRGSRERLTTEPWRSPGAIAKFDAWTGHYARACREQRIDYVPPDTRTPFDRALLAYLEKRARLM
jgi:hypothetical protein